MNFPFFSKKQNKEYYLGIFLKEDQGVIMIFMKENNKLELLDREKFIYSNSWENLTNDVDEALYKLEKNLDVEIKKTIIFVYSHLVDEKIGDIKAVYLQKIKQLTKALDLQPLGYIECHEAIGHSSVHNALLIELDKTQVGVFSYKNGQVDDKIILSRTSNIIEDLTEGFEKIKQKSMLPARIILYDSDNLDDTATKILTHHWASGFFVQLPKIDILSSDEVINSLMNIFGEQIKGEEVDKAASAEASASQSENFGFLLNEDISEQTPVQTETPVVVSTPKISWKDKFDGFFNKLKSFLQKNKNSFKGNYLVGLGIVIILLSLFINEYFFHKAELTVYLPTQNIDKIVNLELDYRTATSSANYSEVTATTGKQEVGNRARGTVTIHNFDDNEKVFSKGSILRASNIEFSLDADVKVASSSLTADGSAKLPGKNTGTISASQIGPEGNLAKGQRFTFNNLSSSIYFAVNDAALSGGTKKQIQTVARKDQDSLKATIIDKAKKEIPSIKALPDEVVLSALSQVDFSKLNFSNEVGEESNKLTLQASVNMTQFLYSKKTFVDKTFELLSPEVKPEYELQKQNISYTIDKILNEGKSLKLKATVKAKANIRVSGDEIKKSVIGKNQQDIKEILKNKYKIDGYNLIINESLPIFNNYLPFFTNNITLKNSNL